MRRPILLCGLLIILVSSRAWALDPSRRISQYAHTAWRIQDGFFSAAPRVITQTRDGYLWIGTENGLLRFDGVRFVEWTPPAGQRLPSPTVVTLLGARDGSLWIGTASGLSRWRNGELTTYAGHAWIRSIIEDRDGSVWVTRFPLQGRVDGALCRIAEALRCFGEADGLPFASANSVAKGADGDLWIGSDGALAHWRQGAFAVSQPPGLTFRGGLSTAVALAVTEAGSVWVGSRAIGNGLGQLVQGVVKPFVTPELDGRTVSVNSLLLDREDVLWVGTLNGLWRISGDTVERFLDTDGLSSSLVQSVYEDREGNLWTATPKGIDCFRNQRVSTFSAREGFIPGDVDSLLVSRDGTLWIGGGSGLNAIRDGKVHPIRKNDGQVTSMLEDHAGRLWVGVDDTLAIYERNVFTPIKDRDGTSTGLIVGLAEDTDHNVWAEVGGGSRRLLRIADGKVQEEFAAPHIPAARQVVADPAGGIWLGLVNGNLARYRRGVIETFDFKHPYDSLVNQVAVGADGAVLAATEFGLLGWKDGIQQVLTERNGLPCNAVNAFIADAKGGLWLYMHCGLVELTSAELRKWWTQPAAALQVRTLDAGDGVQPGVAAFRGAAATPDGRLWFANGFVVQMIDPAGLGGNLVPPPVRIEGVVADHERYAPEPGLRIPPRVRDLEIDYTALSFGAPQRVRFRYQLEGRDPGWQEAGTRRQAFYTDLPPARYTFRVTATNTDGVWNEDGATLEFSIAAAWYQTGAFKAIAISGVLLAVWGAYRLRLQQLAGQFNVRLEARVGERTRIAREMHDTLLQTLHGLLIHFQAATNLLPTQPEEAKHRLERVIDQAARAITEGRETVQELRAPALAKHDLAQVLGVLGQELISESDDGGPVVRVNVEGTPRELHPVLRDDIYRIAAEALRNAVRHAGARLIQVDIQFGDRYLHVRVRDDGKGIDPKIVDARQASGHWGLSGMRERAELIGGRFEVLSQPGSGTEVTLSLPAGAALTARTTPRRSLWRGPGRERFDE